MRTALYLGAAFVVAVLTFWFWTPITDALAPKTTGDIFVSGPQIYTRERLVNDRYREDAWLLAELTDASKQKFGLTMSTSLARSDSLAVATTVKTPAAPPTTEPPAPPAEATKPTLTPTVSIDISPQDRLNALRTYREQIRTLMIENQLDDRHDLRGNSLYRLRFDATVLPGANTQNGARITVTVLPPDDLLGRPGVAGLNDLDLHDREAILSTLDDPNDPLLLDPAQSDLWKRIYARWLDSLTRRFDDSRKAIIRAYETNQFTSRQYDKLLGAAKHDALPVWLAVHARDASVAKLPPGQQQAALRDLAETALAPSKENAAAMKTLRTLDAGSDEVRTSDPGHAAFQYEIERVIAVVRDGSAQANNLIRETIPQPRPDPFCGDLQQYGSLPAPQGDNSIKYDLRYLRDQVFEPQIFNTVLGLGPNTVANSTVLAQFASGLTTYGAPGPAFTFYQQRPSFVVSDVKECFPKRGLDINHIDDSPAYFIQGDIDGIKLALPSYDPRHDIEATIARKWTAPTDKARIDTIFVDVGLTNFIRMAGRQLDVFSYALPPAEPDELNAIQSRNEWSRLVGVEANAASLPAQASGRLKAAQERAELSQRLATRKLVVSFGEQPNSAAARFGWVIQPQEPIDANRYRQRASQTSLTALVSLPAWWEAVKVNVATAWEGDPSRTQSRDYLIVLPVNFETIDASLFEANDRSPVINEWAMNGLSVTPCVKTEIIIPGRRLWRSTVVTLGGQRANGITVMPDMNGIVATFDRLDFPSTWTDLNNAYKAQLMVWTSQGSAQPYWVTFKNSGQRRGCPDDKSTDKSTDTSRATPLKIASP